MLRWERVRRALSAPSSSHCMIAHIVARACDFAPPPPLPPPQSEPPPEPPAQAEPQPLTTLHLPETGLNLGCPFCPGEQGSGCSLLFRCTMMGAERGQRARASGNISAARASTRACSRAAGDACTRHRSQSASRRYVWPRVHLCADTDSSSNGLIAIFGARTRWTLVVTRARSRVPGEPCVCI